VIATGEKEDDMRVRFLVLTLGTACLGLVVLALPAGRAGDDHGHGGSAATSQARLQTERAGSMAPMVPPTKPYRSSFYFPDSARADRKRVVRLYDNYYSPSLLWVPAGTEVRFVNDGRHSHTITCNWLWESGELKPGKSFSLTFTQYGTYYYYCRHHTQWMRGTVTVY
jgi:plastocyanin